MSTHTVTVYRDVEEANRNQWNHVVTGSALGSCFQRHEWLTAVEAALDADPYHLVVEKKGNPIAVFPNYRYPLHVPGWDSLTDRLPVRELVSSAPGYGGPIVLTDEEECLRALFDELDASPRTLFHTVRTNDLGFARYGKTFARHGYEPVGVNCRFRIDLRPDWESIQAEMDKERRRVLRQADDVVVEEASFADSLDATYRDYHANVTRAGGSPFPRAFLAALRDHVGDRLTLFTASLDDRVIGRFLHVHDEEQATLHHYFAAVGDDDDFRHHPSEILHAHSIQWAAEQGYDYYDFGGTGAHFEDGVFRHKERYGGELVPTLQWQRGFSRVGWPAYKVARGIYRRQKY